MKQARGETEMWRKGARLIATEARRIARFDFGIESVRLTWDDGTRQPAELGSDHVLFITAGGRTAKLRVGVCTLGDIVVDTLELEKLRKVLAAKIRQLA